MPIAELLTLIISTFILAKSSSAVVDSAVKLANFFRVRTLAIGMLLVAVSTSLPELSVSTISSAAGEGAIAAGNVFGSNIANLLLILGFGAFLYGFKVERDSLADLALVFMLTTVISVYILFHSQVGGSALGVYEGILLLAAAVWYGMRILHKKKVSVLHRQDTIGRREAFSAFLFFGAAIVIVIISSSFVVESAVKLAEMVGLAKSFIGATLIAVGTSLPELTVDLQAIRKKEYGLALGDAIGSNMINITLVLGVGAVINPIFVQLQVFVAALLFAILANAVFMYISIVNEKFGRKEGIFMLLLYVVYLVVIFALQIKEAAVPAG